jgi:EpsI family protein
MVATSDHLESPVPRIGAARPFILICGLLLLAVAAMWPDAVALARIWQQKYDYSHGWLIIAVALIWFAQLRRRIDAAVIEPTWLGLPVLALTLFAWLIAYRGSSDMLTEVLLPIILWVTVWTAAGPRIALLVAGPIAYLCFAIPLWEHLVPLLQWLTTEVVERALGLLRVPATVVGNDVTIPSGTFVIAEGCSGKRYLIVALPVAVLMGVMQQLPPKRLLLLVAAAAGLALVINWIRVVTIIWLGYVTQMHHYLVAVEHITFGLALFIPLVLAILLLARWLASKTAPAEPMTSRSANMAPRAAIAWKIPAALLASLFVVTTFAPAAGVIEVSQRALPLSTGDWQGPMPSPAAWRPHFEGPDVELNGAYTGAGRNVAVYLNIYGSQQPGKELVYYRNSVVPEEWSHVTAFRNGQLAAVAGNAPNLLTARDAAGEQWLIANIYNVGGVLTTRPFAAQILYGARTLLGGAPAGVVAVATQCGADCDAAAAVLDAFWQKQGAALVSFIQPARQ